MPLRKIIAYSLLVLMFAGLAAWAWFKQRQERLEKERRHGPRRD